MATAENIKKVKTLLADNFDKKEEGISGTDKLDDIISANQSLFIAKMKEDHGIEVSDSDIEKLSTVEDAAGLLP
ncbi:hypothetical protein [Pseudomonas sp. H9]|uniref:hypothetical protein n=1 Tax=Pseudomonas sp. H9 TaxID=483968 RepID=UPI001057FE0F|nr:hypothetical protein [Pseudomonas sp. H9]TDF83901.1 hypothetical protein E1573_09115 [Pseudomonas sp. H9]